MRTSIHTISLSLVALIAGTVLPMAASAAEPAARAGGTRGGPPTAECDALLYVPSSNFNGDHRLNDVDARSRSDVWAVGHSDVKGAIAYHWNGSAWRSKRPAKPPAPWNSWELQAVTIRRSDDVWAAGWVYKGDQEDLLVERWNGQRWRVAAVLPIEEQSSSFSVQGVVAIDADDVWILADLQDGPVSFHWDGEDWERVGFPADALIVSGMARARGVGLWVSGSAPAHAHFHQPAVWRWTGTAWTRVTDFPGTVGRLDGIDARSGEGVIGVGGPLAVHGPDPSWTTRSVPAFRSWYLLNDVAIAGRDDAWAIGQGGESFSTADYPVIAHWNGAKWKRVKSGLNQRKGLILGAITNVPGSRRVYAVGYQEHDTFGVPDDLAILRIC